MLFLSPAKAALRSNPALFLDRDGIINEDKGYVHKLSDVVFVEGIFELCKTAANCGYTLVCVTNQSGIGRHYFTTDEMNCVNDYIQAIFKEKINETISYFYVADISPSNLLSDFNLKGFYRKPFAGLFIKAASEQNLDLGSSIMIGDRLSDVVAAHAAGVGKRFLLTKSNSDSAVCNTCYNKITNLTSLTKFLKGADRC